jgi:protein angel
MSSIAQAQNELNAAIHNAQRRPEREYIPLQNCELDSPSIRILSYNILADYLVNENINLYRYCKEIDLAWENRCKKILDEILFYSPAILCLQEAQEKHLYEDLLPTLKENQYKLAIFQKRTSDNKHDGCAILYKSNVLKLIRTKGLELYVQDHPILDRDNVAVISRFQFINDNKNKCSNSGSTNTEKTASNTIESDIIVATIHVVFNPKRGDVKMEQSHLLCEFISEFVNETGNSTSSTTPTILKPALFICGDFNSGENSAIYKFFRTGNVDLTGVDHRKISGKNAMYMINNIQKSNAMNRMNNGRNGRNNRYDAAKKIIYEHSLGELSSLYDCTIDGNMNYTNNNRYNHNNIGSNEPWFTSFSNGNHPTTVDFLYFTPTNVQPKGYFSVPNYNYIKRIGHMPNELQPSDHVSLIGDFSFNTPPVNGTNNFIVPPPVENSELSSWPSLGESTSKKTSSNNAWPALGDGNKRTATQTIRSSNSSAKAKKKKKYVKLSLGNY